MKEEQGKKLDPNDPAIPAEPDKPTALPDEDLDTVAGGSNEDIMKLRQQRAEWDRLRAKGKL